LVIDDITIRIPLRGVHNVRNAMLALAVARELGVSVEDAARGLEAMVAPPMRSNMEQHGAATLINDAYNSNPGSARAALELLQHTGKGRQRVAVLGTMLELGPSTPRLHDDVARDALNGGVELVAAIGEFATALGRIAPGDSRVITAGDVEELWSKLCPRLAPDAVILLKGSRGMRLERLVAPISDWAQRRTTS
jgi:UDP-N-acetylmuramoyl-tripeptide--D-alanyl-D-alanine ligase